MWCEIGFVPHNRGRKLGSFHIIGAWHAVPVRGLGSFRIFEFPGAPGFVVGSSRLHG